MDKINETLYSSIDEELNLRNRKAIQPDKLGEQHFISLLSRLEIIGPEKARI